MICQFFNPTYPYCFTNYFSCRQFSDANIYFTTTKIATKHLESFASHCTYVIGNEKPMLGLQPRFLKPLILRPTITRWLRKAVGAAIFFSDFLLETYKEKDTKHIYIFFFCWRWDFNSGLILLYTFILPKRLRWLQKITLPSCREMVTALCFIDFNKVFINWTMIQFRIIVG